MTDTQLTWRDRVAGWRASGLTAAAYSEQHRFAVASLRWWSSRLKREDAVPATAVRLAQVVRQPDPGPTFPGVRGGTVVVELLDARARVRVEPGAERETLELVLDVLGGVPGYRRPPSGSESN